MGLPEPLAQALSHHEFINVPGSISRHRLEEPPQMVYLRREHHIQRDVADMVWSGLQQSLAALIRMSEGGADDDKAAEERKEILAQLRSRLAVVQQKGKVAYEKEDGDYRAANAGAAAGFQMSEYLQQLLEEKRFLEAKIGQLERKNAFNHADTGTRWMIHQTLVGEMHITLPVVLAPDKLSTDSSNVEICKVHDVVDLYDKETGHVYLCRICRVSQVKHDSFSRALAREANVQAWLLHKNGYAVKQISVLYIFKDYSENMRKTRKDYPTAQVMVRPVNFEPVNAIEGHVYNRLYKHALYRRGYYQECDAAEMWKAVDTYDIMHTPPIGREPARKAYQKGVLDLAEARKIISNRKGFGGPEKLYIQMVPGERTRCMSYCPVAGVCLQHQRLTAKEAEARKIDADGNVFEG